MSEVAIESSEARRNGSSSKELRGESLIQDSAALDDPPDVCVYVPVLTPASLRAFRRDRGWTQEEFAAHYELSLSTVKRWEGTEVEHRMGSRFRRLLADFVEWAGGRRAPLVARR